MSRTAVGALIRNDLRLFLNDRRAVVVGVLVPILIAAFFGYVFGGSGASREAGKVPVAVVDEDGSDVTKAIIADLAADSMLQVTPLPLDAAREQVKKGRLQAAAIFPPAFGARSVDALFTGRQKPEVELLVDPSQAMSAKVVEGMLAQYSMKHITKEAFNGSTGRKVRADYLAQLGTAAASTPAQQELQSLLQSVQRLDDLRARERAAGTDSPSSGFEFGIPYAVKSTAVTAPGTPYNSYAHSFAGMSVQFILFAGIDAGIVLLLTRQRGIWQRLRAAPISKGQFVVARVIATALISALQLAVIYLTASLVFRVRIQGSIAGFVAVAAAFCLFNGTFGLMLATLGRSAAATRGIAIMVMLLLVMLGGAWVPAFVFPAWLQQASKFTPTRWAVDGLDAMTWRGLPFAEAGLPVLVLGGCALLFLLVAIARFRWDD